MDVRSGIYWLTYTVLICFYFIFFKYNSLNPTSFKVSFTDPIFILWFHPSLLRIKKITPIHSTGQKTAKVTTVQTAENESEH